MKAPSLIFALSLISSSILACAAAEKPARESVDTSPGEAPAGVAAESAGSDAESGGSAPSDAPVEAAPEGASPSEPPAVAFDAMSPGDKLNHMKTVIAPGMQKVFAAWEPEEFEKDFGCTVCHGARAKQGNFAMPNPDLPLNEKEMKEHPDVTEFMKTKVVPEMAKLMGEAPYDPATGKGFGCFSCHTKKN